MEDYKKALSTNFDLFDFLYVHFRSSNNKEDNFFFNAEIIENLDDIDKIDLDFIKLHPKEFSWETLCYYYDTPWFENLIDTNYNKVDWFRVMQNPKIIWNEHLLNKYWEKLYINAIISYSGMFWNEYLVRFIISKHDKDSTKIFWLEKFAIIKNIIWNLKMILDFPTSYWISNVVKANTLEVNFEDLKNYKNQLNNHVFQYLQVSITLLWQIETILEFKEFLSFHTLSKSKNVEWSNKLISTFEEYLDFEELSKNTAIPLNDIIIKKYGDRWNFNSLSSHHGVKWNLDLIKIFIKKIDLNKILQFPIDDVNEDFIEKYKNNIDWGEGCSNYLYYPSQIAYYNHIPISVITLKEKATNWEVGDYVSPYWSEKINHPGEWHGFSYNNFLTFEHLEEFHEKLSWEVLSSNEYLTITNEMLTKFSEEWNWSIVINRKDFKLEHFYAIHKYLDFDFLNVNSQIILELLKPDKNEIFTHLKSKLDNINNFKYSLRDIFYGNYDVNKEHFKKINQIKKDFLVKRCKSAICEFNEFNNENDKVDKKRHYNRLHYWLHANFKLYNEITSFPEPLKKTMSYTSVSEFHEFYYLYVNSEYEFKNNYFEIFEK